MVSFVLVFIVFSIGFILNHILYFQKKIKIMQNKESKENFDLKTQDKEKFKVQIMCVIGDKRIKSLNILVNDEVIFSKVDPSDYNHPRYNDMTEINLKGDKKEVYKKMLNLAKLVVDSNSIIPIHAAKERG